MKQNSSGSVIPVVKTPAHPQHQAFTRFMLGTRAVYTPAPPPYQLTPNFALPAARRLLCPGVRDMPDSHAALKILRRSDDALIIYRRHPPNWRKATVSLMM